MTNAASLTHSVLIDNIMLMSNSITVFSGPNQLGARVRVVVAERMSPVTGEVYEVIGDWRVHEKYGLQFHSVNHKRTKLSGKLVLPFLQGRLKGIGPERARRIYDAFGGQLGEVLSDPDRIIETAVAMSKNGEMTDYSIRLATMAHEQWNEQEAEYQTFRWLEDRGVDNASLGRLVARILGDKAADILNVNPYILSSMLSWNRMEKIGLPILRSSLPIRSANNSPERFVGAADNVMRHVISKGHTAVKKDRFRTLLSGKLRRNDQTLIEALRLAELNGAIIDDGDFWRAPGCAYMEDSLTKRFGEMASGAERSALKVLAPDKIKLVLDNAMAGKGHSPDDDQYAAVIQALNGQLKVLTGGGGTGKTTLVNLIADVWEHMGGRVELAALAGKAALRMSQATGRPARTIFRLLKGLEKREMGEPSNDLPLLDDKTLLIIDEASMVDLGQWHRLVQMMPKACRLLMVGDVGQLSPIGFGLVFHLLATRPDITHKLTKVYRQTDASGIPMVAADISIGKMPTFAEYSGIGTGVSFLDVEPSSILKTVLNVAGDLGGFWSSDDLMICTALNEAGIGVSGLNDAFSKIHQGRLGIESVKGFLGNYFLPGDPVIFLRNDYKEGLFNGSLGRVTNIDVKERRISVNFDGEEKWFSGSELYDLKLAYALTCHKAQGSQAKRVIIPIATTGLMDPTWLYTAVTRAEEQCVLIGEVGLLEEALRKTPAHKRRVVGFSVAW